MFKKVLILVFALPLVFFSCTKHETKIACVGDSITEGAGLAMQSRTSYPVRLDSILGEDFTVLNAGRSATTLRKKGDFPHWICKEFSNVFAFEPDLVIIKLGTNDTKPYNWNAAEFEKDYQALIDTLSSIAANPIIYLCYPVPVYKDVWGINDSTVTNGVIPVVTKIAGQNNLEIIDLYSTMENQAENFPDGVHPNENGAKNMAILVAEALKK
jgi:alpha-L-fucosidase 2